jgi:hypothetical protein
MPERNIGGFKVITYDRKVQVKQNRARSALGLSIAMLTPERNFPSYAPGNLGLPRKS